jgi:ABC-type transport system involved in cytochrome bd biosynthesis fused ATPase/permease subunit
MRRLRFGTRVLTVVLLALAARVLAFGVNFAIGLSGAMVAVLLLASILLPRQGRQLEPRIAPTRRGRSR